MIEHLPFLLAGALIGGFTLGLTGFGNGLTSYGVWLHVFSPQLAAPLVAIGSIAGHLMMYRGLRHAIEPQRIWPFVVGGLAGVPIGGFMLTVISAPAFKLFGGAFLAIYSALALAGGLRIGPVPANRTIDGIVGLIGGVCGGLASLSGPVITLWCGLKGWSNDEQRGTYQPYNFAMLTAALVAFGVAGLLTAELLMLAVYSLPATLIGVWIGRRLYGFFDEAQFRRLILVLLILSGVSLVWTSLNA